MGSTSMWQRTDEMAKKLDQSSSTWVRLANDSDKVVGVFLGEPFPREVSFLDGKYQPFTEEIKAMGLKPSLRVALNIALWDTLEVKVIEQGVTFFKDLVRVREKYGLDRWAFEIQRHGAAKDPKTTYSILPEHQLTADQQDEFQALQIHDLARLYDGNGDASPSVAHDDRGGATSIDPNTAQAIAAQLKAMPREAVDRFCQKFGVNRIKDLPASQTEKARAFLEVLASEFSVAGSATGEGTDPFA